MNSESEKTTFAPMESGTPTNQHLKRYISTADDEAEGPESFKKPKTVKNFSNDECSNSGDGFPICKSSEKVSTPVHETDLTNIIDRLNKSTYRPRIQSELEFRNFKCRGDGELGGAAIPLASLWPARAGCLEHVYPHCYTAQICGCSESDSG